MSGSAAWCLCVEPDGLLQARPIEDALTHNARSMRERVLERAWVIVAVGPTLEHMLECRKKIRAASRHGEVDAKQGDTQP